MIKIFLCLLMTTLCISTKAQNNSTIKDSLPATSLTESKDLDEIIIQTTRTSRSIKNAPTRVEVIEAEEVDEKNNMRPANVSMLLHESTGIQVQQTSATSANASIRIQGLDGRYTQLLKDGFPNFGNFASGLSILEIPPLDLKQVEIIKGPASTLYGGGAIAGVVNFISKQPKEKAEYNLLFNQSNIGQTNIGLYASQRNKKTGYTLLVSGNLQQLYDVDKDDFSELPTSKDFSFSPKLFLYPAENTTIALGNSFTAGKRKGGDVQVINNKADGYHTYFEENNTLRNTSTLAVDIKLKNNNSVAIKQGFSYFSREIKTPGHIFSGNNYNSFTDLSYLHDLKKHLLLVGTNFIYDKFNEKQTVSEANRDNNNYTAGIYLQDSWEATEKIKIEAGLRLDHARYTNSLYSNNEFFVLPRFSVLLKINDKFSSRIGAGAGYKTPTLFTEQTETMQYQQLSQLSNVKAERSAGITADLNYKTRLGTDLDISFNQLFFYTNIRHPLVLQQEPGGNYFFTNVPQPVQSMGFETNAKFIFKDDLKLFAGYTFTKAKLKYLTGNQSMPLVPRHKLNLALIYEKESNFKLGLEGYFTDRQYLSNGLRTSSFWEFGFMAEKTIRQLAVFVNFENFTDTRQSNFKRVVNDPHSHPVFDEIWTHTEGFTFNGGIKLKL